MKMPSGKMTPPEKGPKLSEEQCKEMAYPKANISLKRPEECFKKKK